MNIENIPTLRVDIEKVGPQGFSAYEIYLQGGGTLSETEWLESLKGETGATPDVQAGETITLQPEEQAKVTRTGTIENPVFTFAIPQGKEGVQGIRGPEGKQGIQGPEGKAGEDGKSAYQIWLEAGNEGTEQDFLNSLIGPEGSAGISLEEVKNITGDLDDLSTEDKSNLVNAINEISKTAGGLIDVTSNLNIREIEDGLYVNKTTSNKTITVAPNSTTYRDFILRPGGYFIKTTSNNIIYGYIFNYYYGYMIEFFKSSSDSNMEYASKYVGSLISSDENKDNITGIHTYTTLPESSTVPTKDNQFTNKKYVDDNASGIKDISGSVKFTDLDPGSSTWAAYYTKTETTITGIPTLSTHTIPAGKVVFVGHYNTSPMTTAGGLWYWTTVGTAKGFGIANGIGSLTDRTMLAYSSTPTIQNQWTFNVIPKTEVVPTNNAHLVNKKYVDDAITASITTVLEGEY